MKKKVTLLIYILFAVVFLAEGVVHFAYDRFTMPPEQQIGFENFNIINMKQINENTFISVTNDPYFEMIDGDMYKMHTVRYKLAQSTSGARSLYYTTSKEPMYSGRNAIIVKDKEGDNTFEFILPMEQIRRIRLDISGEAVETITVEEITINYRPDFMDYYSIEAMDIAKFLFIPPVIASVIFFIVDLYRYYIKKEKEEL